jgi:hypothetical protein
MKDISPKRFDIAATCLHYLQSDEFGKDYRYTFGSWTRYQALHYIINHWGDHVKDAEDSEYVQTSVVAFLASASKRSWMQRIAGPELRRHYLAPYHCRVRIRNNLQTCPRGTANWTWQCVSILFLSMILTESPRKKSRPPIRYCQKQKPTLTQRIESWEGQPGILWQKVDT